MTLTITKLLNRYCEIQGELLDMPKRFDKVRYENLNFKLISESGKTSMI